MQFDLNEDHVMIRDMVRRLAVDQLADGALERDEGGESSSVRARLAENGLWGILASADAGGSEMGLLALTIIVEELAKADASVAMAVAVHNALIVPMLTDTEFAEGAISGSFLPGWAPALGSMAELQATQTSTSWTLDGPTQAANPASSEWVLVQAHNVGVAHGWLGKPSQSPLEPLGLRGLSWTQCDFSGHSVQPLGNVSSAVVGQLDVATAAVALGIAQSSLEAAGSYAAERVQFGKPLTAFQATQFKIADMATRIEGARLLVWAAAEGNARPEDALRWASQVSNQVVDEALQLHGGYGYTTEYAISRHYRDAKMFLPFTKK